MILQDYEAPLDKSLSYDDALFVAQSRVIRRIASEKPCVIVGRCANYILKGRPNTIHLFLFADMAHKTQRAVAEYGIDPKQAESVIADIDKARREHFYHYTGEEWGDSRNYTATFDTGTVSSAQVAQIVQKIYLAANTAQ